MERQDMDVRKKVEHANPSKMAQTMGDLEVLCDFVRLK